MGGFLLPSQSAFCSFLNSEEEGMCIWKDEIQASLLGKDIVEWSTFTDDICENS